MKFKPHHVAFTVINIEQSVAWYKDKLGFEVIYTYSKNGMEITLLKLDEVAIELFCFGKNIKPLPDYRKDLMDDLHIVGTKHLCIEVENLDQTVIELKKNDIEFTMNIDTAGFGGRYVFFKDCNGILIELYEL